MSGSNRRDRGALIALGLALLTIVVITWLNRPIQELRASPQGANVEQRQEDDVSRLVAAIRDFDPWADTYAQWLMAVFGVAATLISYRAIVLVDATLKANTEAVSAAREANKIAQEIGEAQVRAYLQILAAHIQIDGNAQFVRLRLDMRNSGQSPARNVEAIVEFTTFPRVDLMPFPPPHFPPIEVGFSYHDLAAGQTRDDRLTGHTGANLLKETWGENYELLMSIHARIVLFADDVFGNEITAIGHYAAAWPKDADRTAVQEMTDLGGWDSEHFRSHIVAMHRPHRMKTGGKR